MYFYTVKKQSEPLRFNIKFFHTSMCNLDEKNLMYTSPVKKSQNFVQKIQNFDLQS